MPMKKTLFFAVAAFLTACTIQETDNRPVQAFTVKGYIQDTPDTRTGYVLDQEASKARFNWLKGDEIDAVVSYTGGLTSVRMVSLNAGTETCFEDTDGRMKSLQGAGLFKWAFYPSRTSEDAQNCGYNLEWSIRRSYYDADKASYPGETELVFVDLPSQITLPASNPLTVVPMTGVLKSAESYYFSPMTGVLAVPVKNIPAGIDFIRIQSGEAAFSGSFHLDPASGTISQKGCVHRGENGLTLAFSDIGDSYTFFFPVAAGTIPAGMTVTVGCSSDPETVMTLTTAKPLEIVSGHIAMCPEVAFAPVDQKWAKVADGKFLDDFIWGAHSSYTAGTWVDIAIEQSGLHPEKYRIANPYTTANSTFGYTPYTDGIEADPYLVFTVGEDGFVSFNTFKLGVEDKDSGGKPMMITWAKNWSASKKGTESKVVSTTKAGDILEIQLGAIYSDPDDSGYFYTRDGEGNSSGNRIHIQFIDDKPETWIPVLEGTFKDDKIWSLQGFTGTVPIVLEESSKVDGSYRIANPYLIAKEQFNYSTYTDGITGDEYVYFTVAESGSVKFTTFLAGIEDKASGGKPMKVWYPTDWGSSYDASYNKLVASRYDGRPAEVQFSAIYSGPTQAEYSYKYTQYYNQLSHLVFPMDEDPLGEEVWSQVGKVQYKDNFIFSNRLGYPSDTYVTVDVEQSNRGSGTLRIPNPYPLLASQLGYTIPDYVGTPDEYMYITVNSDGSVYFKPLHAGINLDTKDLTITHPSEVSGKNTTYNKIGAIQENGLPDWIQLAPIFHETGNVGYLYSRDTYNDIIKIVFGAQETPDYTGKAVVNHQQYPLVPDADIPIAKIQIGGTALQKMTVKVSGIDLSVVQGLRLWNSSGWMNDAYIAPGSDGCVTFDTFSSAAVSGGVDLNIRLTGNATGCSLAVDVQEVTVDGAAFTVVQDKGETFHAGLRLNHGGDQVTVRGNASETVASFRIPALVTTNKGTLIAAYDVRYASSTDLQADIDVGMKRSTDGGKTWSDLQLIMDMGEYGGLGQDQNGIGDPCLLVDQVTGDIFCFAVWTHGHAGSRSLSWAGTGFEIADTPQLMMVRSSDDGLSWSNPVNLTRQVKRADWMMTFQGPGRGITMKDGTLVIPCQHQEGSRTLHSGIMYSTDHGLTWHIHNYAYPVTSEAAVAEIEPGVLLLSMRDESNSRYRRAYVTRDLGRSWTPHASNGLMVEPTCEASLIHVDAADNSLGKDLTIFSNPHSNSGRNNISIQISLDKGVTWPHILTLDSGSGNGYTCLTMVDSSTVGLLYESSKGHILFQAIPLGDVVR